MKKSTLFLITSLCLCFTLSLELKAKSRHKPVNQGASAEAKNLLDFIYNHANGKRVIAGHHEYNFDSMNFIETIQNISGKYPALYGCELGMTSGESPERAEQIRLDVVKKAVKWWKSGGIVTLCWHECKPGSTVQTFRNTQLRMSQEEFNQLLTPGTEGYKLLVAEIDQIAVYLKMLRDEHIPVLWRPYHEMNGGWFWWGKKNNFKVLWNLLYDRLTVYHKLNNLVWVWGPNCPINKDIAPYADFYPGPSKVDILGFDAYVKNISEYKPEWYDDLVKLAGDKPVAMAECGLLPDASQLSGMYSRISWWMTWRDVAPGGNNARASAGQIKDLYNHPRTITRDLMSDLIKKPGKKIFVKK